MDKNQSLVSVIVPCYNHGHFLSETLESVISQTYQNWECLIVNDGSTDNTEEITQKYCNKDNRFKQIKKLNGGLSSARNAGLKIAQGTFVQFLDSDDILLPNKFEIQLNSFLLDKSIDISISRYRLFKDNVNLQFDTDKSLNVFQCNLDGFLHRWNIGFVFPPVCYLVKMDFLRKNSILFNENIKAMEDWIFLVNTSLKGGNFFVENDILALYRRHENNMSSDRKLMLHNLIKTSFVVYDLLPSELKTSFIEEKSFLFADKFAQEFRESVNFKKANSIDYKVGYYLLYPLHKLSSFIKKIISRITK